MLLVETLAEMILYLPFSRFGLKQGISFDHFGLK